MPRPKVPLIDRDHAVRAALRMIDTDGLSGFSIEKLARRIGVKGPSLYYHFTDRADVLSHVATLVLLEVPDVTADASLPWDRQLTEMALELRRAILRHPNAAPVLLEHFPRQLVLAVYERVVATLEATGIPDQYHVLIFEGMEKLTLGSGLYMAAAERSKERSGFPDFDDEDFPALNRAVVTNKYDDHEVLFETSCRAFLTGVKALIEREQRPAR